MVRKPAPTSAVFTPVPQLPSGNCPMARLADTGAAPDAAVTGSAPSSRTPANGLLMAGRVSAPILT